MVLGLAQAFGDAVNRTSMQASRCFEMKCSLVPVVFLGIGVSALGQISSILIRGRLDSDLRQKASQGQSQPANPPQGTGTGKSPPAQAVTPAANPPAKPNDRSEERRVGKECRSRW